MNFRGSVRARIESALVGKGGWSDVLEGLVLRCLRCKPFSICNKARGGIPKMQMDKTPQGRPAWTRAWSST